MQESYFSEREVVGKLSSSVLFVSDLKFNQLPKAFPTGRDVSHVDPYTKTTGGWVLGRNLEKNPYKGTKILLCGHCWKYSLLLRGSTDRHS